MQNKKTLILETLATLLHDNISNVIIIAIAKISYDIELSTSLKLWLIGQFLNISFSFGRRWIFNKHENKLNKVLC